jgi:hypothetical protein
MKALRVISIGAIGVAIVVLVTAALTQAQGQATPMPRGGNVLLGRVVEMGTESPVGGAVVVAIASADAGGKPITLDPTSRVQPPSASVMSTGSGYFVFRDLPAGRFSVVTRAAGYVSNESPPFVVEVIDGQKTSEIIQRVWKYGAIGGRLVDERGEPITGMPVHAKRRGAWGPTVINAQGQSAGVALTDDRGVYRIPQLVPGDYTAAVLSTTTTLPANVAAALDPAPLNRETFTAMMSELRQSGYFRTWGCPTCISNSHEGHYLSGFVLQRPAVTLPPAPDGRALGFANTFYPGTTRAGDATFVSLGSGESRGDLDLTMRLTPTRVVSGVLNCPEGPMRHAVVNLIPPGIDSDLFAAEGVATAITDERGSFAFLAISPGEYVLSASVRIVINETAGTGHQLWARQEITVGDADVSGLAVTMRVGVSISGRVVFQNATGGPPRPARHVITPQPIRADSWRTIQAVVQPDGSFRTGGDPPGRYLINAGTGATSGWFLHTMTLNGKPLIDDTIDINETEVTGLVLTYGTTTNRVSGRVDTAAGTPDADAAVIMFAADSNAWREAVFSSSRRARMVRVRSTGAFEIASMAPGEYYLAAVPSRLVLNWQDPRLLERLVGAATRVTLGVEEEKTVTLRTITPGR